MIPSTDRHALDSRSSAECLAMTHIGGFSADRGHITSKEIYVSLRLGQES